MLDGHLELEDDDVAIAAPHSVGCVTQHAGLSACCHQAAH